MACRSRLGAGRGGSPFAPYLMSLITGEILPLLLVLSLLSGTTDPSLRRLNTLSLEMLLEMGDKRKGGT